MVCQSDSNCEPTTNAGGRGRSDPLQLKVSHDIHVQAIEFRVGQFAIPAISEAYNIQANRKQKLQFAGALDGIREIVRLTTVLCDQVRKSVQAMCFEGKPDLERAKSSRQFRTVLAVPGIPSGTRWRSTPPVS